MNDRYVLYVAVFLSIMATTSVFLLNFRQKETLKEEINKKSSIFVGVLSIICSVCLVLQGIIINKIYNINSVTYKSQIEPISLSVFESVKEKLYPKEVKSEVISLNTKKNNKFSLENQNLFIPGETINAIVDLAGLEIDDFRIDFDKSTSCFTLDKREYSFVNKSVSEDTRNISPTIWQNKETGVAKLYIAVPLSNSEELLIYTDVTDAQSESIDEIAAYLVQSSKNVSVSDEINININGFDVAYEEILFIGSDTITFKDESFLSTALVSEKQLSNIKSIYTDKVLEFWQTSKRMSEDSKGRKAYVYVKDGIRYNLFSKEENFESICGIIEFDFATDKEKEEN